MRSILLGIILIAPAIFCAAQEPVQVTLDHSVRRIAGVVRKEDGATVPNIDVEVFGGGSIVSATKTDSHGKFSADSLEPGDYEVWFTYKSRQVFYDAVYKVTVAAKGSKEPIVVKLKSLR